ncbi:hypothetical protein HBB16_04450 [Pseudonocardia sp. MCCB 268]|nr:hypothetical protein [Pseudonocardia cytotoxica]
MPEGFRIASAYVDITARDNTAAGVASAKRTTGSLKDRVVLSARDNTSAGVAGARRTMAVSATRWCSSPPATAPVLASPPAAAWDRCGTGRSTSPSTPARRWGRSTGCTAGRRAGEGYGGRVADRCRARHGRASRRRCSRVARVAGPVGGAGGRLRA